MLSGMNTLAQVEDNTAYDRSFETADYSAQTRAIGGAFDVNAALKESIEFLTKNSFQSYME